MFDITKVQLVYPEQLKVYGPYFRADGRKHVVLTGNNGYRRTVSFPKFIKELEMQVSLGDLTIDHQDRDKTNDDLDNLVVRPRSEHVKLDVTRIKVSPVLCPICGTEFIPSKAQRSKYHSGRAGPFCSRSCAGRYGKSVQMGGPVLTREPIIIEKYQLDK